jgi:hypothetical protein
MTASMKMTVFCDVAGSKRCRNFGKHHQTTRRNIPEDGHLRLIVFLQELTTSQVFPRTDVLTAVVTGLPTSGQIGMQRCS